MSFDALAWAAKQSPGSSAEKLVLLGLAECASRPDAYAFPSTAALVEFSSLDRKTVVKAIDQLEQKGFITDTGKRMGTTGQVKVYKLLLDVAGLREGSQKRDASKGSQFSHERLPKTGHGISKGISTSRAKALSVARTRGVSTPLPEDFEMPREWVEWAMKEKTWNRREAEFERDKFIDDAIAKDRRNVNWERTWRNWCRSEYCKTVGAMAAATAYRNEPMRV